MAKWRKLDELPDLLAIHQYHPQRYPYLLSSNTQGQQNTRWSLLLGFPLDTRIQAVSGPDILDSIELNFDQNHDGLDLPTRDFPFIGGWFVFLSYEYASRVEPGVTFFDHEETTLPVALISRIPVAVIIDHLHQQAYSVASDDHVSLLDSIAEDINHAKNVLQESLALPQVSIEEEEADNYRNMLDKIQHYIREGDIFQANVSRVWKARFEKSCDPTALFRQLKQHNPAPFSALVKIGDSYIVSSSPERLVSVKDNFVETRPIAGTHPRDPDPEKDRLLSSQLLAHPKERAEHVMLIDLERNDLGRICIPGTVHVGDRMTLETYQHVHHIVSSVKGRLKADVTARDIIHAVFPGGTITGCPKVRCMEIISELEQQPRSAYTGSLGYISDHGLMDLNILIRTITLDSNVATFRAGAGIVSDSDSERELQETRHKARGMINALQSGH